MGNSGLRKLFFPGDLVESPYKSLYNIKVITLEKEEISLQDVAAGKFTIVVNTGSQNPTFKEEMQQLNQLKQNNNGQVEIIAFPSNQFHNEPANFKQVAEAYKGVINFPVFSKVEVNGEHMHPVYKYLKRHSSLFNYRLLNSEKINEDFCKFLLNKSGEVACYYPKGTSIEHIQQDINTLIAFQLKQQVSS